MRWHGHFVSLHYFFRLYLRNYKKPFNSGNIFFPDISQLTTSLLQEQSLQKLREHAVVAFKTLADETRHIRRIMSTLPTDRISSHNPIFVESHHSSSSTEQTIVAHSNPEAMINDRPLAVKKDGFSYPQNPTKGYISRWRDDFRGCLTCGSNTYRFASCTACSPSNNATTNSIQKNIAPYSRKRSDDFHETKSTIISSKEARFYAISVHVNNVSSNTKNNAYLYKQLPSFC